MQKNNMKKNITFFYKNAISIVLIIFIIFMVLTKRSFSRWANIANIINECSVYGITACAMTVAIICGEFDLSCSSIFALSTVLFCIFCNTVGIFFAFIFTIIVGIILGAFNGFFVAKMKMSAFIVTLGTMTAIKGLAYVITKAQPVNTQNVILKKIGSFDFFGISIVPFFFFLFILFFYWFLKYTKFGRSFYATGGNYEVAKLSGINVELCKFTIFIILGICASFSGIMYCSRIYAGWAPYGSDLALWCVAATVIGGTSLSGGSGGILKTLVGVLVMAILFNALTLLGVGGSMQKFVRGIVLIVVIMFDNIMVRKEKQ